MQFPFAGHISWNVICLVKGDECFIFVQFITKIILLM